MAFLCLSGLFGLTRLFLVRHHAIKKFKKCNKVEKVRLICKKSKKQKSIYQVYSTIVIVTSNVLSIYIPL